jgi:hypothetical protein
LSLVEDLTFCAYYYRTTAPALYVWLFDSMSDVC